ncbi:hypothetical protein OG455_05320 [Kitasatospora sp. NBC_01287]|uniref:hypothetical protein n=1 Tax=Kitasatospora TaxID=2063 RepID=UPI0022566978|nr:hypothetical protein [Kitasatospora sp. NBC_01287]MCX4744947.1 hypothetical protein [Kitasatospora sp. NBC_01287]
MSSHVALEPLRVVDHLALEVDVALELGEAALRLRRGRPGESVELVADDQIAELLAAGDGLLGFDFVAEPGAGGA